MRRRSCRPGEVGRYHRWRALRERAGGGGTPGAGHAVDAGDRKRQRFGDHPQDHPLDAAVPLSEIVQQPEIQQLYGPLYERHIRSIDIIRRHARTENGVIFFDLIGDGTGRLQQIHSLLSVSRLHLHGIGEHLEFSHQGFGGVEPLGAGDTASIIWRPFASATAEAGILAWAPSASKSERWSRRARWPMRSGASWKQTLRLAASRPTKPQSSIAIDRHSAGVY